MAGGLRWPGCAAAGSFVGRGIMIAAGGCEKGPHRVVWPLFGCLSGGVLLSHTLSGAVPLALVGLASGFGMGPGVSPPLWPP
jgi:hypothetical protein